MPYIGLSSSEARIYSLPHFYFLFQSPCFCSPPTHRVPGTVLNCTCIYCLNNILKTFSDLFSSFYYTMYTSPLLRVLFSLKYLYKPYDNKRLTRKLSGYFSLQTNIVNFFPVLLFRYIYIYILENCKQVWKKLLLLLLL